MLVIRMPGYLLKCLILKKFQDHALQLVLTKNYL